MWDRPLGDISSANHVQYNSVYFPHMHSRENDAASMALGGLNNVVHVKY